MRHFMEPVSANKDKQIRSEISDQFSFFYVFQMNKLNIKHPHQVINKLFSHLVRQSWFWLDEDRSSGLLWHHQGSFPTQVSLQSPGWCRPPWVRPRGRPWRTGTRHSQPRPRWPAPAPPSHRCRRPAGRSSPAPADDTEDEVLTGNGSPPLSLQALHVSVPWSASAASSPSL